jgi:CRISPR/Cas system CSM-associated protein Csm3 (group 7 of RAMP superfamily)
VRDRDRLIRAGRNDPDAADQQREHPYDFVALPDRVEKLDPRWINRRCFSATGLWGDLTLRLTASQPIVIGNGVVGRVDGKPARLMATNAAGHPVVPGSSLKGSIRANYEAITRSCVWNGRTTYFERPDKLPKALGGGSGGRDVPVRIDNPPVALRQGCTTHGDAPRLCPACGLFGALGYKGRLGFEDGVVVEVPDPHDALALFERVPAMSSGQPHRIGWAEADRGQVLIKQLWGRRVALNKRQPRRGETEEPIERVQALQPGTELETRISLVDVQPEEVGGLLIAVGIGHETEILRLGGCKSVGFGLVRATVRELRLRPPRGGASRKEAEAWIGAFRGWQGFWPAGLAELTSILARVVSS